MSNEVTQQTLDLVKASQAKPDDNILAKAGWVQPNSATSGINAYDLEAPAKQIYPVNTPLRNMIPRDATGIGTAANWRTITGINTQNLGGGLSEGDRGGVLTTAVQDNTLAYRGIGFDDSVTFEADYAGKGFDDPKALAAIGLLRSLMIYEEKLILGGNTSNALGTTPTPTLADVTTGGSLLANTTYRVICVALTLEGFLSADKPSTTFPDICSINGQVTRTNADGSTTTYGGGSAQQSAAATVTTANDSNNTHKVSATVTPVNGAVAYAWFVGTTSGTERLNQITTINSAVFSALNSSGQLASAIPNPSADNSRNLTVFDGILSHVFSSGSNSIISTLATGTAGVGTVLSANGADGVTEIDTVLEQMWNTYQLAPTHMWVNAQERKNISKKILQSGSSGAFRINGNAEGVRGGVVGNSIVSEYLNQFSYGGNQVLKIMLHPFMPAGTILFTCDDIPYPIANVANPLKMKLRRDYYQIDWPMTKRKYEYGVYFDGMLQNYFTPAFALLTNIANG